MGNREEKRWHSPFCILCSYHTDLEHLSDLIMDALATFQATYAESPR